MTNSEKHHLKVLAERRDWPGSSWRPVIYLAGAIRDKNIEEDVQWREDIMRICRDHAIFLNPLAGKTFKKEEKIWTAPGDLEPDAGFIVNQDFWGVDHADIILANFVSLSQGYNSIGTLIEFGRSTYRPGCVRYSIVDPGFTGHDNVTLYKLHPFIQRNSAVVFRSVEEMLDKFPGVLLAMNGAMPYFGGIH